MLCFISNASNTAVRIGYTTDPVATLARLQSIHGGRLRLSAVIYGSPVAEAFLQALDTADHIVDRWFRPSLMLSQLIDYLRTSPCDDEVDWLLSESRIVEAPAKLDKADVARGQLLEQWQALEADRAEAEAAASPPKAPGPPLRFRKASEYAATARAKALEEATVRAAARRQRRKAA